MTPKAGDLCPICGKGKLIKDIALGYGKRTSKILSCDNPACSYGFVLNQESK